MKVNAINLVISHNNISFNAKKNANKKSQHNNNATIPSSIKAIPLATFLAMSPVNTSAVNPNYCTDEPHKIAYVENNSQPVPIKSLNILHIEEINSEILLGVFDIDETTPPSIAIASLNGDPIVNKFGTGLTLDKFITTNYTITDALGNKEMSKGYSTSWSITEETDSGLEKLRGGIEIYNDAVNKTLKKVKEKYPPSNNQAEVDFQLKDEVRQRKFTLAIKPNGELYLKEGSFSSVTPNLYDKSLTGKYKLVTDRAIETSFGTFRLGYISDPAMGYVSKPKNTIPVIVGNTKNGKPVQAKLEDSLYSVYYKGKDLLQAGDEPCDKNEIGSFSAIVLITNNGERIPIMLTTEQDYINFPEEFARVRWVKDDDYLFSASDYEDEYYSYFPIDGEKCLFVNK